MSTFVAMQWRGGTSAKSAVSLQYPMELQMAKFSTRQAEADGWTTMYNLGAVVLHYGSTIIEGHYVMVLRQPDGTWMTFNDDKPARPQTATQVLSHQQHVCGLIYHRVPLR